MMETSSMMKIMVFKFNHLKMIKMWIRVW